MPSNFKLLIRQGESADDIWKALRHLIQSCSGIHPDKDVTYQTMSDKSTNWYFADLGITVITTFHQL